MRKFQKLVAVMMLMAVMSSVILTPAVPVDAKDALSPYREKLMELNMELGTSYSFPSEEELAATGETYADLVQFYTDMTMEEFRQYVVDAYERAIASVDQTNVFNREVARGNRSVVIDTTASNSQQAVGSGSGMADPFSYNTTQRYYYTIVNYNNLYIKATCYSGDGERYSSINSYGESHTMYPYYYPTRMSTSYSTGRKKVTCSFNCLRYLAKNIVDDQSETIAMIFTAGGGNMYKA